MLGSTPQKFSNSDALTAYNIVVLLKLNTGKLKQYVYVFLSLFIKFSAMGLHQDIRNDIIS